MSGRKSNLTVFHSVVSASMAADVTSPVTNIKDQDNVGFQVIWTGVPVGTFAVEVSNSHAQDSQGVVSNAGTWSALTFDPPLAAATGAAGDFFIDVNQAGAAWIRFKYTATSGTGTLNVWLSGKQV